MPNLICRLPWAPRMKCRLKRCLPKDNGRLRCSYCRKRLAKWHDTSLGDRLEKNINLMTLQGRPMPFLRETEWIGKKPAAPSALRGKVVLLFFWAHWCSDCKAEAPILAKLGNELKARGLVIVAPTRRYGYTFDDDHAPPAKETPFITKVFEHYYAAGSSRGRSGRSRQFRTIRRQHHTNHCVGGPATELCGCIIRDS